MELGEKLKELRKLKGLTQEEVAGAIFVSRTAVSKWESGRGYPSIELLKAIAKFFGVTIDQLLSSEKLLTIAEKENKANITRICRFLFGFMDLLVVLLIALPLYPKQVNGYVYAVHLIEYSKVHSVGVILHWLIYILLFCVGGVKIFLTSIKKDKGQKLISLISLAIGSVLVLLLAVTREPYCVIITFIMLVVKIVVLLKQTWPR